MTIPISGTTPPPDNPNWLTGLASKLFYSFWNPNTWTSSSSSSYAQHSENESGDDENPSGVVDELKQQQQGGLSKKSRTLHLIEQLLMFEQFSREESDSMIEVMKSRVLDYSMTEGGDAGSSTVCNSTYDETSDICNQAIMEAKMWVEENKVKSGLKSNLDNEFYALKSAEPQATEGDAGSTTDVAKLYMKARPPLASPISHDYSITPLATDLFMERIPFSGGGTSFSSAKEEESDCGSLITVCAATTHNSTSPKKAIKGKQFGVDRIPARAWADGQHDPLEPFVEDLKRHSQCNHYKVTVPGCLRSFLKKGKTETLSIKKNKKDKHSKQDLEEVKEAAVVAVKYVHLKKKTKGRSRPSKMARKKQEGIKQEKRSSAEKNEDGGANKKQKRIMEMDDLPVALQPFASR